MSYSKPPTFCLTPTRLARQPFPTASRYAHSTTPPSTGRWIGVTPEYIIEVRADVLDEKDGPMLIHGLQGFHGTTLRLPEKRSWFPDRQLLEARYLKFRQLAR
jgi:hypothetical protein